MSFIDYLKGHSKKKTSATVAKERLQIIVSHSRNETTPPDYLPELHKEIIGVVSKYIKISKEQISVTLDSKEGYEVLELNIVLPETKL